MSGIELYAPRTPNHRRTWTWATIALTLAFYVAGQVAMVFGVMVPLGFHSKDVTTHWDAMALVLLGFGITSILIFLWVILFERRGLSRIGFTAGGLLKYLRGYAMGLAFLAVTVGGIYAAGGYRIEATGVMSALTPAVLVPLVGLMLAFMVQGATEEVMFRGWLMQLVASRHGIAWAVGGSSLFFALMHAGNISPSPQLATGLLNIVLVAIFLAFYAIREGSLWGVCAWHGAWNWLLGVGFGLEVSGEAIKVHPLIVDLAPQATAQWWLTGSTFGPEASLVTTAVLSAGVVWAVLRSRKAGIAVLVETPAQ